MPAERNSKRRQPPVENSEFRAFVRRIVRAYGRRIRDDGDRDALGDLASALAELSAEVDATAACLLSDHHASYAEIAEQLGITRQAVQKRYPLAAGRLPGGQPSNLR